MFSLCSKLRVCPLFEISPIDQPLFRGWGPPVRGGIVIWLDRALWALGSEQHVIGLVARWAPLHAVLEGISLSAIETEINLFREAFSQGGCAPECSRVTAWIKVSGSAPDMRQHSGRVVHQQGRQDQIIQTDLPDDSTPQVLQLVGHQANASSPSRFTQHPGRFFFAFCNFAHGKSPLALSRA